VAGAVKAGLVAVAVPAEPATVTTPSLVPDVCKWWRRPTHVEGDGARGVTVPTPVTVAPSVLEMPRTTTSWWASCSPRRSHRDGEALTGGGVRSAG